MASSSLCSMGGAISGSANCSVRSGKVLGPVEKVHRKSLLKTDQHVNKVKKKKKRKANTVFSQLCHLFIKHQSQP